MAVSDKYMLADVTSSVFRAYDIRGIVPEQLNENAYYTIGRAIATQLKAKNRHQIIVGRDGRLTSLALSKALIAGLIDSGCDVTDIGMVPSPVLYFATNVLPIDSGVIVTGSHNPSDYNGIKIVLAGKTLVKADIEGLYQIICQRDFINGEGKLVEHEIISAYIDRIVSDLKLARPLKVVIDCGNGVAGSFAPKLFRQLGCDVIELFCEVDGRFPNHHPDPSIEENLVDLKKAIALHQADLGLAFDGDADRIGVVTNEGEVIWPDRLMMLYAKALLADNPGANIVYDVKCSSHLTSVIQQAGGNPLMCPTGHSIVKGLMKEKQALLAGEMSGHIFFQERWYGFDDGLYSACRLLEIVSGQQSSVSDQFKAIPDSINTPEIKITIDEQHKFAFMDEFTGKAEFPDAHLITIDGVRVEFPHGWGLVRASNTTPCLVARFEANSEQALQEIQSLIKQQLLAIEPTLDIPF